MISRLKGIGLFFSVFLLFMISLSYSQSQTGVMTGIVVDDSGQALPSVEVKISSPALITPVISRITNEKGFFRFPYLPPGLRPLISTGPGHSLVVAHPRGTVLRRAAKCR